MWVGRLAGPTTPGNMLLSGVLTVAAVSSTSSSEDCRTLATRVYVNKGGVSSGLNYCINKFWPLLALY